MAVVPKSFLLEKLDQTAIDIEFLLFSVVQGVALGVLAAEAAGLIEVLHSAEWISIGSRVLFILA